MTLSSRRAVLILLGLPAVIALGLGGGYTAARLAASDPVAPAPTTVHDHGGHVTPDGSTMSGTGAMPEQPTGADTPDARGDAEGGTDMGRHTGAGGHDPGHQDGNPGAAPEPPRTAVLSTFAAINGGVLMTAFALRRRRVHRWDRPPVR